MRLKPVNDKIVVKPIKEEETKTTSSGIILPDTAYDGSLLEGKVVAVGIIVSCPLGETNADILLISNVCLNVEPAHLSHLIGVALDISIDCCNLSIILLPDIVSFLLL